MHLCPLSLLCCEGQSSQSCHNPRLSQHLLGRQQQAEEERPTGEEAQELCQVVLSAADGNDCSSPWPRAGAEGFTPGKSRDTEGIFGQSYMQGISEK